MNRHPLDIFSLGAGLAFLVIAVALVVEQRVEWSADTAIVFPVLLVLLGVLGLVAAVRAQRTNDEVVRAAVLDGAGDLREHTDY